MSAFDTVVLIIVGVAAIGGFARGLVHEVLALSAWVVAILVIHYFHTPFYELILPYIRNPTSASVLAFAILLLASIAGMKLLAKQLGGATRKSMLGPIDRVLGFGFGAVKGALIVVVAFSILVLGYDTIWGVAGRPAWMTQARTYPAINAGADEMVTMLSDRHEYLNQDEGE